MMRHPMIRRAAALAGAALVAGCAAADREGYPSLAPRPAETRGFAEPPVPAPSPDAPDAALDARIAATTQARRAAAGAFDRGAEAAEAAARRARGAPAGSEAWLDAQTALAELDSLRSTHQDAIDTLEDMAAARAQALAPAYPALDQAIAEARAAAAEQTRRIDAIAATLAPA